jgi:hypothetical protein
MECQRRRNDLPARFFLGLFIFWARNMDGFEALTFFNWWENNPVMALEWFMPAFTHLKERR